MVKSCPSPNPASTLTNVKYANDNISTGDSIFQARVQCTLNANTDYIVVTSGSNNATQGTFNNQISGPGTATIVKLIAFSASGYADGVLLAWRTGYEVDNLGFRLYRDEGEQVQRPATIVANQPSQWRKSGQGADLVIISHRDFPGSLEPLRALRQGQGLAVTVVDVEDIYDEFSYGQQSPYPVKGFLRYAVQQWKPAPRFVLLVGHASYDPKGYLGYGGSDLVPTKLIDTQLMETASYDWFVDLDDDGLADMAMGRLPVRTTQEASELVAKIVGYETTPSSYSLLLVAGRNDTYNFEGATKELHSMIPAEGIVNLTTPLCTGAARRGILVP
jgi:hypothetical protein